MKRILVLLIAFSFLACSKDKDGCNSNATMFATTDLSFSAIALKDLNQIHFYDKDQTSLTRKAVLVLPSGKMIDMSQQFREPNNQSSNNLNIIDFNRMIMTTDDGPTPFKKDVAKNDGTFAVYKINSAHVKNSVEKSLSSYKSGANRVCGVKSANGEFKTNESQSFVDIHLNAEIGMQLTNNVIQELERR